MADLQQLEQLEAEIRFAERRAVEALADHLREAVRDLPSESRLGLTFVRHAQRLDLWATGREMEPGPRCTLEDLGRDLRDMDDEDEDGGDA